MHFYHDDLLRSINAGEQGETQGNFSKGEQMKSDLLEALNNEDYQQIKEIYERGSFKGKDGQELRRSLEKCLNEKLSIDLIERYEEWQKSTPLRTILAEEYENGSEVLWEMVEDLFSDFCLQASRWTGKSETILEHFEKGIPTLAKLAVNKLPEEAKFDDETQEIFRLAKQGVIDELLKKYPQTSKSVIRGFFSKRYSQELRFSFIANSTKELIVFMQERIQEIFEKNSGLSDEGVLDQIFEDFFTVMMSLLDRLGGLYQEYLIHDIQTKMRQSHERKQLQTQTSSSSKNKEPEPFFRTFFVEKLTPEQKHHIENVVDTFDLGDFEKKELKRKLIRLVRNSKPFKKSDYVGEGGLVSAVDESKLMDLVDDLGLEHWEEKTKDENSVILSDEGNQVGALSSQTSFSQEEKVLFDAELPVEKLVGEITQFMESLDYAFENRKQLEKQLADFLKTGSDNKKSVLAALGNPEIMRTKTFKNSQIYAISLTPKHRLILLKQENTRSIDSFHTDHDAYEDRIDALK